MPIVATDTLDIAYTDSGPTDGVVALLIHGWPDDASTWDDVAPRLHAAGLRTIIPTLRGFGDTRFRDESAPRTGNSAIHAMDMIALLDGLGVDRFMVAGHDWGSNIAEALAVGWPKRVRSIAMLSTPPRLGGMPTPPFWHDWGPSGWYDEATFDRVAVAWDNPDWVDVTLHSYRSRWDEAEPDAASAWLEEKVKATRTLALPALYVQGEADGVNPPAASEQVPEKFTGRFRMLSLPGVGHFPQREAPEAVASALIGLFVDQPA